MSNAIKETAPFLLPFLDGERVQGSWEREGGRGESMVTKHDQVLNLIPSNICVCGHKAAGETETKCAHTNAHI